MAPTIKFFSSQRLKIQRLNFCRTKPLKTPTQPFPTFPLISSSLRYISFQTLFLSLSISFVSCFSAAKEDEEEEEEAHIFVFFSSLLSFFRFETNTNISCPFNFLSHKYHIKTLLFPLSQNQDSSFFLGFQKINGGLLKRR